MLTVLQPPEVKEAQPAQQSNWARNLKIGAAAVAGGTILAVTGAVLGRFPPASYAVLRCAHHCTASSHVLWLHTNSKCVSIVLTIVISVRLVTIYTLL